MSYRTYSTYIQTSNQAIRNQKPNKKGTNKPKTKKTTQKLKIYEKISKKYVQKRYMTPPTHPPKYHNVLIGAE